MRLHSTAGRCGFPSFFFLAFSLLACTAASALDTLVVGKEVRLLGWRNIAAWGEVNQVTVGYDSVLKWDVEANMNLVQGAEIRKGIGGWVARGIYEDVVDDSVVTVIGPVAGLEKLVDGDPSTAFDPDEAGMPRMMGVVVNLGAIFNINRIRLYPRLDEEHRLFFPQLFKVSTALTPEDVEQDFFITTPLNFGSYNPNREPVVDRFFQSREARYVLLEQNGTHPWELAELEIYSDGTVPLGTFQSIPIPARHSFPVWGKVRYEGGDISRLPVVLQTRTGPDRNPIQYFRRTGVGDDLEVVAAGVYNAIPEEEQGPVRPNPDWSGWSTVTDGLVRSPGLNRYIQFRLFFPEPGTIIRNLIFEYAHPPVVQELHAEIDPRLVEAGEEQTFVLSMVVHMLTSRLSIQDVSTGFRRFQVLTAADVAEVEKVLIDDRDVPFSASVHPREGFLVNLGQRVDQDGTFLQVVFRGSVFRDATRFEVRVLDYRFVEGRLEEVYQAALEDDVDPVSPGGDLVVRLERGRDKLLVNEAVAPKVITPNGDGINDTWEISYDLLKLTQAARVRVDIFDLKGRPQYQAFDGEEGNGAQRHVWDGLDEEGKPVAPGVYLYQVRVETDHKEVRKQGLVGVAY